MNTTLPLVIIENNKSFSYYHLVSFIFLFPLTFPTFTNFLKENVPLMYSYLKYKFTTKFRRYKSTDYKLKCHKENNFIRIYYTLGENEYEILLPTKRLPDTLNKITDENDNDITKKFKKLLGPKQNFHNQKYKVKDLGYKILKVEDTNENLYIFQENDFILFN